MRKIINIIYALIIIALVSLSMFYTVQVLRFKAGLNVSSIGLTLSSGSTVTVKTIIDGDEISVQYEDKKFIVRILGIYSYDTAINDPLSQNVARQAFLYLENTLLRRTVALEFDEFKLDKKNRLLASVVLGGTDIGHEMVKRGLTLVYTKYAFPKMEKYLIAQEGAQNAKAGLWADQATALRSRQLKIIWDNERAGGE